MDFTVPADRRVKMKENEKKEKYLDLSRVLKTVEHKSTFVSNMIGSLDTVKT